MKKQLFIGIFTFLSISLHAQYQLGNSISNYSGVNGLYLNPSSIADSRFKFHANLFGLGQHLSNDYMVWNAPYNPFSAIFYNVPVLSSVYKFPAQYLKTDSEGNLSPDIKQEYLGETVNGKAKNALLQTEIRLPSFMFNINKNNAVAFSARARGMFQLTNVSEPLARMVYYGFDTSRAPFQNGELHTNELYSNNSFNVNALLFAEMAGTYARTIVDLDKHYLKGGLTVKYFVPVYSAYVRNQNLDVTVYSDDSLSFNNTGLQYGYVNEKAYLNNSGEFSPNVGLFDLGGGMGFDLGFTYEYRPQIEKYTYRMDGKDWKDRSKNKYLFRVSGAVNDMGAVKLANDQYVRSYKLANKSNIIWSEYNIELLDYYDSVLENQGAFTAIDSVIQDMVGLESASRDFRMKLPASFNINLDVNIYKGFYANVLWIQTLRSKDVNGLRGFSLLALTPRFESRWVDVSVPLALTQDYKKFRAGFSLRTGPVYIGTDNLNSLVGKRNTTGADIYFGITLPVHRKKHRDKDQDGTSNRYDKCPKTKGLWEFSGCPDTDGDGVQDSEDSCVNEPGKKELGGCPDRDNDSVIDRMDECPDDAGLPEFAGCPDRDGDGIPDKDDMCPNLAGPAANRGCPDRDGDGVIDPEDECPDQAGPLALSGCPDRDGDGVADKYDKCPNVYGPPELSGCPDTDGDGIPDYIDLCPLEKGPAENNGCPEVEERIDLLEITEEEEDILKEVFENLEFATSEAEIQASSLPSLDELVRLLEGKPLYRIYIAGHTDNTGKKEDNLKLSRDRAEAVKKYLTGKGIDPSRIKTEGFGMDRPVVSNDTPEGKQKNRRVEFRVIK
jgi:outer membrane protein OmpA-like peptidoglycan-associated protein